jgi:cyclic-di-AMP phosphodiesterase PgpH
MRLKEISPKIYEHAIKVSELSGQAAKAAGLNELLAKAGGMYHEIGRLDNSDYIKAGVKYAKEYDLPVEVITIINSHNLKYSKPVSPESAVVNLTISVLAAREFLRRNQEESRLREEADLNKLTRKAIEELFTMRLSKNSLDESGLTLKQFHILKNFFLEG